MAVRPLAAHTFRECLASCEHNCPTGSSTLPPAQSSGRPRSSTTSTASAFLRLLGECVRRFDWDIYAYCLMTTHYHLVLRAAQQALSEGMRRLNGLHARRVNLGVNRRGHLFGARYSSWLIESEEYASAPCRYVLLNPVRAGLCERPEDWRWSGSRYGKSV
jgi:REP element-mobilizing transposase RayT